MMIRRALLAVCVVATFAASTGCGGRSGGSSDRADSTTAVGSLDLQVELLAMARADRELRAGITADRLQDSTIASHMLETQKRHTARMKEILDEFGWPGTALVGKDGVEAAWLLVQHGSLDLQTRVLGMLQHTKDSGVSPADIAMLTDRVLVGQGKPQRYGTQFSVTGGRLVLDPLVKPDSVDVWRARVGLGPLADYVAQARKALEESPDSLRR